MRLLKTLAVAGASALALTGCVFAPATHTPPTVESVDVTSVQSRDQVFLDVVRIAAPDARGIEDHVLIEAAHASCDLAREFGYDAGIEALALLALSEGWGEDELIVLGAVYGGAVATYCPEVA